RLLDQFLDRLVGVAILTPGEMHVCIEDFQTRYSGPRHRSARKHTVYTSSGDFSGMCRISPPFRTGELHSPCLMSQGVERGRDKSRPYAWHGTCASGERWKGTTTASYGRNLLRPRSTPRASDRAQ